MRKKLFKFLGGFILASPPTALLVISIRMGYMMELVLIVLASVLVIATTVFGLWLMGAFE